jgi:hypothetical protein
MLSFASTIFLSAFLLFQVQLILGKYILPWFGGTPGVWTTCLLVFQVLLLGGYVYAHALARLLRPRSQRMLHGVLVAASVVAMGLLALSWRSPILPGFGWKPSGLGDPTWRIIAILVAAVGLPYLILSSTSPLLQEWFARARPGASPYRLYSLSNLGSLLGLITYPFVVEPDLRLGVQAWMWAAGYALFALGVAACAAEARHGGVPGADGQSVEPEGVRDATAPLRTARVLIWFALPACASTLLLAATNQMCQEVAVIPFLWVLPLALYLLSFILAFQGGVWIARVWIYPLFAGALVAVCIVLHGGVKVGLATQIAVYALTLFAGCMLCHSELVRLKPHPRHLTAFYLAIAGGGAAGGVFVALVAPHIFTGFWELHIALFGCALLALVVAMGEPGSWWHLGRRPGVRLAVRGSALAALVALGVVLALLTRSRFAAVMVTERNFFGVLRVLNEYPDDPVWNLHSLIHGRILHGFQYQAADKRRHPTVYFRTDSGVGLALQYNVRRLEGKPLRIGVLGLGVGTLAAYGEAGDVVRFYEINPAVISFSEGKHPYFTFLADCPAKVEIVLGDARVSLERELARGAPQRFDVLALDAFTSDAVPVHLLTAQAFHVYLAHLRGSDSIIAVNISNRYLDLEPVLVGLARYFHLTGVVVVSAIEGNPNPGVRWVLLARSRYALQGPLAAGATPLGQNETRTVPLWTDEYSNLFRVLKHWR